MAHPEDSSLMTTFATVAAAFLERPGLTPKTLKSYESTLLPVLKQLGSVAMADWEHPTFAKVLRVSQDKGVNLGTLDYDF